MEFEKKTKIMEKSWNFKISVWKNHGKTFLSPVHSNQQIFRAARTSSNGDAKIDIVCFNLVREGVAKRGGVEPTLQKRGKSYTTNHNSLFGRVDHGKTMKGSWKIMEKSWNLILGNCWEPCKCCLKGGQIVL